MQGIPRRPFVHVNLPTPRVTRYSTTFLVRLLGLLGDVGELQVWRKRMSVNFVQSRMSSERAYWGGGSA